MPAASLHLYVGDDGDHQAAVSLAFALALYIKTQVGDIMCICVTTETVCRNLHLPRHAMLNGANSTRFRLSC